MMRFPVVPNAPGVPPLLRSPSISTVIDILTGDLVRNYGAGLSPSWGVYRNGEPVIIADTVISLGFKREWAIADYPVERGGFETYDKVDIPYDARVQFVSGGDAINRQTLLDSIDTIAGDLNLYDVVTPEKIYESVNVQHYDFRRQSRNGLGLLIVDVWLLEVRIEGISDGANAKSPSGAAGASGGYVQPSVNVSPTKENVQSFIGTPVGPSPNTFNIIPTGPTPGFNLLPVT